MKKNVICGVLFTVVLAIALSFTFYFSLLNPAYKKNESEQTVLVSQNKKVMFGDMVEIYLNPMYLYLEMGEERFHGENGKKDFVKFIEKENRLFLSYALLSNTYEEYVRRWEEQKILARLGLPERKLTDKDVFRHFYAGEAQTIGYLLNVPSRTEKQIKQDRIQARHIALQYWGIPQRTPANKWKEYIERYEQILIENVTREKEKLDSFNHVAMLGFISFFLNDEGATDDAFYYCMVALTRNYQTILKSIRSAEFMLKDSSLSDEDKTVLVSRDMDLNFPATAISAILSQMNLKHDFTIQSRFYRFRKDIE